MKGLTKITLLALVFVTSQAYSKYGFETDGGVSGGGGFLISPETPDQYTSPQKIEDLIKKHAESSLEKYLISKKQKFDKGQLPGHELATLEPILKQGAIFNTMKKTNLVVEEDHSCFGAQGEPTDASFFNQKKKAICISAKNIAEKVHPKELKPQALALMMHEYSEIMGLADQDAVGVQKIVLDDLKSSGETFGSK